MRISIFQKIFIALLLSSAFIIATMAFLTNASFKDGFQGYLNQEELEKAELLVTKVSPYYSDSHGWTRIKRAPHLWAGLLQQIGELPPPKQPIHTQRGGQSNDSIIIPMSSRINLLDADKNSVLGPPSHVLDNRFKRELIGIRRNTDVVGYIAIMQSDRLSNRLAEQFLSSQTQHIATISIVTIVLSLLFSLVSARYIVTPLRSLHKGANAVSNGDLDYQISYAGNDEVADVTQAFNQLVSSLKRQEAVREQWLLDISHELRTPLAVLQAELEALQDGIRKPEPSYIASLHQQVLALTQLVEDLRTAAKTDAQVTFSWDEINLASIVANVVDSHSSRYQEKSLSLSCHLSNQRVMIKGDGGKLTQVLNNLLENSYRYTDEGGEVEICLSHNNHQIQLDFEDSSPGVPDEDLHKLCDRLYRVDASRSRALGGSGLGLAICKNIIEAHNGDLHTQHSSLGGLKVIITLPME